MAATTAGAAVLIHLPRSRRETTVRAPATARLPPVSITVLFSTVEQCVLPWKKNQSKNPFSISSSSPSSSSPSPPRVKRRGFAGVQAFYNPLEDPIFKEALKEPIAFMGGMFAGLLRLDLNEEPLKEWITRTVEAAGITEEISTELKTDEDAPQQIEIE